MSVEKDYAGIDTDGEEVAYNIERISIANLEFDPENPRIGYYQDTMKGRGKEASQKEIMQAIKFGDIEGYRSLLENIESSKCLLYEIWVYPSTTHEGKYVIVDGNTRVTIFTDLHKKYPEDPTWMTIPAKVLPSDQEGRAVDFIRLTTHLQGINNWQSYDRARYIHILYNEKGYDLESLKQKTKLTVNVLKKWLQAFVR